MSDLTNLSADEVQAIADQLAHFGSTYAEIAKEMRENGFETIDVKGIATLGYAMERIVGSVGSAQKALAAKRNPAKDKLAFLRKSKPVDPPEDLGMVAENIDKFSTSVGKSSSAKPTPPKKASAKKKGSA